MIGLTYSSIVLLFVFERLIIGKVPPKTNLKDTHTDKKISQKQSFLSALLQEEKMFKSLFISWLIKLVEIVLVVLLGFLICFLVGLITKETSIGIAFVSICFYFFGGLIRPYIKDLQEELTKNLGQNEEDN